MKKVLLLLALALAACTQPQPANNEGGPANDAFGNKPRANSADEPKGVQVVVDSNDVGEFRGTRMAQLLQTLESDDKGKWAFVRRHVHPRPLPPVEVNSAGKVTRENYDFPPADPQKATDQQKAWRSYLLWPAMIRDLLHGQDWSTPAVRARLANYGRMYELTWKFQTTRQFESPTLESEHWRTYAESMLAYGADGEHMLVSNMILALTNPSEDSVRNAQSVLVNVGESAVEQLCGALWIGFRQAAVLDDGSYTVQSNANFNKYVVETLFRIGTRSASQAVYELENSLDDKGKAGGTAWRFRKHFVDLIGRFGLPDSLRTLEAEIDRVQPTEYVAEELKRGREVVDKRASEDALFVYREYLLKAFSGFDTAEALRGVIRIWALDEDHADGAGTAILRISGKKVANLQQARSLAKSLGVELKD